MSLTLTKRELEVSAILAEGRSNKEIARRLGIAEGTVKLHLNSIYQKLGIFRRVSLIVLIKDQKIAGLGPPNGVENNAP